MSVDCATHMKCCFIRKTACRGRAPPLQRGKVDDLDQAEKKLKLPL